MAQLPSQSQFGDYGEWPGRDVLDSGGERLGGVREIYLDRETGRPEWVLVDVDGDEARFVPLADAAVESSTIRVAHTADAIRNAPGIGSEQRIDQTEERRLYDHYGIGYADSGSGLPADEPTREHEHPAAGPTPTAWGAPDPPADAAAAYLTEPEPEAFEAPVVPPWRSQSDEPAETSSWSAAADDEASNLAPAPAEPPSPEELEAADIPEPPAVTDRASEPEPFPAIAPDPAATADLAPDLAATADLAPDPDPLPAAAVPIPPSSAPEPLLASPADPDPGPLPPPALGPDSPTGLTTPSGAGEILASGAGTPEALAPDALSPPADAANLTAQPGPDTVGVPDSFRPPPPAPKAAGPRPFSPPPAPEASTSALAVVNARRRKIAAGLTVAAVLFFIVRKLR